MRKLINDPKNLADELIDGFILTNKRKVKRISKHVVARNETPVKGQVGIVIGGGAGHEPLFLEFIGKNMADVSVHGQIFAAPSSTHICKAIKAADCGAGVILLYNNYAGDVLNFNMAQEEAREDDGIDVRTVLINDEISAFPVDKIDQRRGTTADHLVIHIAGAAAQAGMAIDDLVNLLEKAVYNSRSLGVSTGPCTLPDSGISTFDLPEGKMEFGMGLHGEAGVKQVDLMTANDTADELLSNIIKDLPFQKGDEVIALINGYGSTTRMEMFIITRRMHQYLEERGIKIHDTELGEFCTAQEMGGISITLMKLDEQLKKYYNMPADSPGYAKL